MFIIKDRRGVSLVELVVAMAVVSIGIIGFFGAFSFISKSLHISRARTLATNLGQEKVESLKNLTYYELRITTAASVDNSFSPALTYDNSNYPPETILIGGITFKRYTFVSLAQIDNDVVSTVTFTFPDTGMKQVTTHITWVDNGVPKKWTLTNLYENPNIAPLDTSLVGTVQSSLGDPLPGAFVTIEQNPDWNATADATGGFAFRVYHGSYTIRASSAGYYDRVSTLLSAEAGQTVTVSPNPLSLTSIASGTVVGNAWLQKDLVISQVGISSAQADMNNFMLQWVELYNPTTAAINIGETGTPIVKLNVQIPAGCTNTHTCTNSTLGLKLVYISTFVAPHHYYVIANTNTFTLGGSTGTAQAVVADDANGSCSAAPAAANWNTAANPPIKKFLVDSHGGSVWLQRGSAADIDAVGWQHNGNVVTGHYEGTYITLFNNSATGFTAGHQIVRISSPAATLSAATMNDYGRAYDSGNNRNDFVYPSLLTTVEYPPYGSTDVVKIPVAGVPAVGALVVSTDPYSGSTISTASYISSGTLSLLYSRFTLPGVTTGTWQVIIASGAYYNEYTPVTLTQGISTGIPHGNTSPRWPATNVMSAFLTSGTLSGFVKGQVSDANGNLLSSIQVNSGGTTKTTGSNGAYFIAIPTGTVLVTANQNNVNSQYVQSQVYVTTTEGQIAQQDFTLSKGGSVTGYLTSGTTPLPNYSVVATVGGAQYGQGTSNTSGNFTIRNLSTGTYTVAPVLDVGQDSTPNNISATVTSAGSVFVGTFTVAGALGSITGTVRLNGELVTTGALLVASTSTLSSTPPSMVASTAAAVTPIYAVSSKADGTYTLPVRGGSTYRLSIYVPSISGSAVTITTKTYTGIVVTPSNATTNDITVP